MIRALVAGGVVLVGAAVGAAVLASADRRRLLPVRRATLPRLAPPPRLVVALADAGLDLPPATVWTAWVGLTVLTGTAAVLTGGPGLGLVALAAVTGGPGLALAAGSGRSTRLVEAALPDALDAVGRSLRSGATLPGAIVEAAATARGRLGDDLGVIAAAVEGGLPLRPALEAWPDRCPAPGVRLAAAAFVLSAIAGGAAARAIDGVAATLRANRAIAGEIRAQAAQARLSALVIALAPLAFGVLAAGTDQRTASFLLHTPFGLACLAAGLALDAIAAWWMHRITAAPA